MYIFIFFLHFPANHIQVLTVLSDLEIFFGDIEPEVEAISDEEVEPSHIMKLVTILNKVRGHRDMKHVHVHVQE